MYIFNKKNKYIYIYIEKKIIIIKSVYASGLITLVIVFSLTLYAYYT
jgi:hypothetical protein